MFIRQKKNKSGVISIQIITKVKGKSKLVKTIGSSVDSKIIKTLLLKAHNYIDHYGGQKTLDFEQLTTLTDVLQNITAHIEVGTDLLLTPIYNAIGFNSIDSILLRELVFARIINSVSKLKTSDYLQKNKNIDVAD